MYPFTRHFPAGHLLAIVGLTALFGLAACSQADKAAAPRSASLAAKGDKAPESKPRKFEESKVMPPTGAGAVEEAQPDLDPSSTSTGGYLGGSGQGVGKGAAGGLGEGGGIGSLSANSSPAKNAPPPPPASPAARRPARPTMVPRPKPSPRPARLADEGERNQPAEALKQRVKKRALPSNGPRGVETKTLNAVAKPADGTVAPIQEVAEKPRALENEKAASGSSRYGQRLGGDEGRMGVSGKDDGKKKSRPLAANDDDRLGEAPDSFDDLGGAPKSAKLVDRLDVADLPVNGEFEATENRKREEDKRNSTGALSGGAVSLEDARADHWRSGKAQAPDWLQDRYKQPAKFLPRMFYFDPTYLGGNAATAERQRRLKQAMPGNPFADAHVYRQNFDAPDDAGMALSVRLDRTHLDRPGRVYLEVGLQGSKRYGWRRPPLDMVVVIDHTAWSQQRATVESTIEQLMRRLGPQDRLGVAVAGLSQTMIQQLARLRTLRRELSGNLEKAASASSGSSTTSAAMELAAERLAAVALNEASIPGTQTVLLLAGASDHGAAVAAQQTAHRLTSTRAVFTSVVQMSSGQAPWWDVAAKGYGNYHRLEGADVGAVVDAELSSLSRVVARLIRVNVRLGPNTKAIRVVGTRKLDDEEVREVKAREVAIDTQLSKAQGVTADRGEDDDGVQTVIPYFYGGDAHVIVLELWVDKAGPVADVTVKYKDMVKLDNATARASAAIGSTPRAVTPDERAVLKNLRGARIAEALKQAAVDVRRADYEAAKISLVAAMEMVPQGEVDEAAMLRRFINDVDRMRHPNQRELLAQALQMAGERKLGISVAGGR